ncbi:ABC transporter ATP-binding protein [Gilvibacter sediminis]|uniref:ABC transporter ATP-binding protein n=1 Tax=Gilvibacter sediminis TaxID=379071 RepID=UPI0023505D41|nr:ABC transporter ATP-binding protein [Gilvibacter sediminis]MDC7996856.1 ABC transporter ATP-binding protein [Gilvibacter sediminis]
MLEVSIEQFGYDQQEQLLGPLKFHLEAGEHLAILGESGSGKSTLLHLIYGLMDLQSGHIQWKGDPVLGPKDQLVPGAPYMKLVAQEANVMPYTTVNENIQEHFSRRNPEQEATRTEQLLELLDLVPFAKQKVKSLSGGQKQRVAIAKALALVPEILLLDEPFAHIDEFRRSRLRRLLYNYLKQEGITCITATHDANEALSFADKVLILEAGSVSFYGPPQELYKNVSSAYQAGFFGEINALEDGRYLFPHQLVAVSEPADFSATVHASYFKGSHYLIHAKNGPQEYFFNASDALESGTQIHLKIQD